MDNLIPPRRNEFLTKEGFPTVRFAEYLERAASNINDTNQNVEDIGIRESYPWPQILSTKKSQFNVVASANYATTGFESVLVVTNAATVTLNTTPDDGEKISIKRATTAGNVTVSGTIDGASSYTMAENYECIDLIYIASSNEWLIV